MYLCTQYLVALTDLDILHRQRNECERKEEQNSVWTPQSLTFNQFEMMIFFVYLLRMWAVEIEFDFDFFFVSLLTRDYFYILL